MIGAGCGWWRWGQGSCILFLFLAMDLLRVPGGSEALVASAGLGPLKAQLPLETCASFLLALGPTKGPCLGLANQDGESLFSHIITTF